MNLGDLIQKINDDEVTTKEIAGKYDISIRTIQNRFNTAGFNYDYGTKRWHYKNSIFEESDNADEDIESFTLDVDEVLQKKARGKRYKETQTSDKGLSHINTPKEMEEPQSMAKTNDKVDKLFNAEPAKKKDRVYKGFYFDSDVLAVINNVAGGKKSDLINEALRMVFKQKGRL